MGSAEPKSDQTVPVMESGLASRTSSATSSESSPTASSSDKDPLLSDSDEASNSRTCSVDLQKNNKNAQLASDYSKEDFPVSPVPRNEQLNDGSAIESPPTQVMDRASETPSHDPNRIPPHVFARTKSTAPVEWSAASNESLFSIHMGNMSFTNEQLNWMNKSGEFGLMGDVQFSGDIPYSPPPPLPLVNKSSEPSVKSGNLNQGLGATEAAAAETMREVIRENACDHNDQQKLPPPKKDPPKKADPRTISAKRSDDSSVKSFAFPILTRDGNKSGSMSIHHEKKKKQHSQPSTPKTASEPGTPKPKSEPGAPTEQSPKATTKNAVLGKWFSCFSCCPFCS